MTCQEGPLLQASGSSSPPLVLLECTNKKQCSAHARNAVGGAETLAPTRHADAVSAVGQDLAPGDPLPRTAQHQLHFITFMLETFNNILQYQVGRLTTSLVTWLVWHSFAA